jgi:hypothetical protein
LANHHHLKEMSWTIGGGVPEARSPEGDMPAPAPLTEVQKTTVKGLFNQRDAKKLGAADLKLVMEALDKAGIGDPSEGNAVKIVGIDEEKCRVPMPTPSHHGRVPPPSGERRPSPAGKKEWG